MIKRKAVYNPEADKRWRQKNKEHAKYLQYRSTCRSFLRSLATSADLDEMQGLLDTRREQLAQEGASPESNGEHSAGEQN